MLVERCEQSAQEVGQNLLLAWGKRGEQRSFPLKKVADGVIDALAPCVGETDKHAPTIPRVGGPFDQTASCQTVDPVGRRPRGHERLFHERPGAERERGACPSQRGEHVELPQLQVLNSERGTSSQVETPSEAADTAEDVQRRGVEIGTLTCPSRHEPVNLVGHLLILPIGQTEPRPPW